MLRGHKWDEESYNEKKSEMKTKVCPLKVLGQFKSRVVSRMVKGGRSHKRVV